MSCARPLVFIVPATLKEGPCCNFHRPVIGFRITFAFAPLNKATLRRMSLSSDGVLCESLRKGFGEN